MTDFESPLPDVDEATERLICRALDGEATPTELTELASCLLRSEAARRLYDEYQAQDASAAKALRQEFESATTAAAGSVRRGLWLATAGAVLTAAAVLAFSFVPGIWRSIGNDARQSITQNGKRVAPTSNRQSMEPTYVDYNPGDVLPRYRQRDMQRDVIGIRGPNNEIYLFERGKQSTRMVPISGEL